MEETFFFNFGGKNQSHLKQNSHLKICYIEFSHKNMNNWNYIIGWKNLIHVWNFHLPKSSMDGKISSVNEIVIQGKNIGLLFHPWMSSMDKKIFHYFFPRMTFLSMDKMILSMDEIFPSMDDFDRWKFYLWMKNFHLWMKC